MEVVGGNLILSKISSSDLDFICNLECDKNLWFFEESVESYQQIVREKYLRHINERGNIKNYDFIVLLATDNSRQPIGLAQIWSYLEYRKSWEIGFAIISEYQGYGYGNKAVNLLLKFAFEKLDAHKVVGMCNSKNQRSGSLMENVGMMREGIFREELYWKNQWHDQWYYSILEKEYFQNA